MPTLTTRDDVHVLDLGDGENRFSPDWMLEVSELLDEVVEAAPTALVTTAGGHIWSNGLDLEWVQANPTEFQPYVSRAQHLLAKVLELPVVTVAAVQGHCFAAGAMLSLCHDVRVMRADRGWWCLPEVDLRMPFTPGMQALLTATLPASTARLAMTTGARFGGEDALARGIVDAALPLDEVLPWAVARAREAADKDSAAVGAIKRPLHAAVTEALRQDD